jgi:hypothetical protein
MNHFGMVVEELLGGYRACGFVLVFISIALDCILICLGESCMIPGGVALRGWFSAFFLISMCSRNIITSNEKGILFLIIQIHFRGPPGQRP